MTGDLPRRLTRTWGDPPPTWDHIIGGNAVTPRAPQVGDIITTDEGLDELPVGSAVLARGKDVWTHVPAGGCARWLGIELSEDDHYIEPRQGWLRDAASEREVVVLYLPGHPPRPEREVKAEALREWAAQVRETYPEDLFIPPTRERLAEVHALCQSHGGTLDAISAHVMRLAATRADLDADRIARGDH